MRQRLGYIGFGGLTYHNMGIMVNIRLDCNR